VDAGRQKSVHVLFGVVDWSVFFYASRHKLLDSNDYPILNNALSRSFDLTFEPPGET
jgi:hypothetical protein